MVGNAVTNNGLITSPNGEVVLAAGNSVELVNPGTPNLRVEITAPENEARNLGTISAEAGRIGIYAGLIRNSGTLNASSAVVEGGRILLKAKKDITLESTSVIDASGRGGGEIIAFADNNMYVDGMLNASAPVSGDGGFIETSGRNRVRIADSAVISTTAAQGKTGTWLIDPTDFYISSAYGGGIAGSTLSFMLGLNDVEIISDSGATFGNGDIFVDDAVSWSGANSLSLIARRDVNINASISNSGSGGIMLYAGWNGSPGPAYGVTAGVGSINVGGDVQSGGSLLFHAGSNINVDDALLASNGTGNIVLDSAGGSIMLNNSHISGVDVVNGNVMLKSALAGGMIDIMLG
jgi:hypothetical protein